MKVVFIDEQTGKLYRVDNPKPTRGLDGRRSIIGSRDSEAFVLEIALYEFHEVGFVINYQDCGLVGHV